MKRPAFTLIEMTVSISIIVLTAVLFIANYHSTNQQTDLTMTAQKVVADIHATQNNTLGLVKYNGLIPAGGWGIHFNTDELAYTIFADLNAPGELGNMEYDAFVEGQVAYGARVTDLPRNVVIDTIKTSGGFPNMVNLTFLPPDPQTNIYDGLATSSIVLIVIKNKQTNTCRTVSVNFLGLAEVLDTTSCP